MSTTAVIGVGILVWVLIAITLALFAARMIKLRDRQRCDPCDAESLRPQSRWRARE
jgi:hypothetical protein